MGIKDKISQLKKDIPAIYLALKKPNIPFIAKLFAIITVAYALSPIDLIPDFIPIVGYLDDVIILPILITITIHLIPHFIIVQCRNESEKLLEKKVDKKWYYAIPIVCIWILLLVWLFYILRG